jgi:hypothetical protein
MAARGYCGAIPGLWAARPERDAIRSTEVLGRRT